MPETIAIGDDLQSGRNVRRNHDLFFFGDELEELDDFFDEFRERKRLTLQFHQSGFRFGNIHERVQHREDAIAFFHRVEQRVATHLGVGFALQCEFSNAAQSCQRRAQIMRNVVECFAHPANERLVLFQHGVEEPRQLANVVIRLWQRHPLTHPSCNDDVFHRADELANRRQRAPREPRAAGDAEEQSEQYDPTEDSAKLRE